ncbi:glycoside hydrolase [Ceraceosorus guamensis]|uniref:beta-glucosidase n=1 Tax=Ceraceosorus guamensis TaxID=1522189 RepID=A0A316W4I1_9BASI|nr:glycoside hydrolase [Ceraceosorus guamensis]PWN44847.1 glycoside hydrolase [Ceraceosorus guamensis]
MSPQAFGKKVDVDPERMLGRLNLEEKISLLAGADLWRTTPVPRVGLPYLKMTDGPNGARGGGDFNNSVPAALFPSPSCLGATFDVQLAEAMGRGIALDSRSKQCHVSLAPTVGGMHRDPRGGRSFESYSESPTLAGAIGAAWIVGCQQEGVAATPKHFVGNEAETDRRNNSSMIDDSTLREIYLAPFQRIMRDVARAAKRRGNIAVDPFGGQPACIMTAYNRLNLVSASEHKVTLQQILRKEWGWKGMIMSDWFALHAHALQTTDIEMPGPSQFRKSDDVKRLLQSSEVTEQDIDARVLPILRLLKSVSPLGFCERPEDEKEHSAQDKTIAESIRRIAREGAVLLKNDGELLPLSLDSPPRRIALIGHPVKEAIQSGGGSANLTPQYKTDPFTAVRKVLDSSEGGKETELTYHPGVPIYNFPPPPNPSQIIDGVQLQWFDRRDVSSSAPIATTRHDALGIDLWWPPRPDSLPSNGWSVLASFTLKAQSTGTHSLAMLAFGDALIHIKRDETKLKFSGEADIFEFILNPAKVWKSFPIHMQAGEEIKIEISYAPPYLEMPFCEMRCGSFKASFVEEIDEDRLISDAADAARDADVAIVFTATGKEWESEGFDRPEIALPRRQTDMVTAVRKAQANTVLINITGAAVELPMLEGKDAVKAAVQTWFGGQESGNAIADILFGLGSAPASGRLPSTWPRKISDHPSWSADGSTFPGTRRGDDGLCTDYKEGRLMGAAGYAARGIAPAFWFGHGLGGYTTFETSIEDISGELSEYADGFLSLKVKVTNTGKRDGKEVVLLFVSPPEAAIRGTDRPPRSLAAFQTVHVGAGQTQIASLNIEQEAVSFWDPEASKNGSWRVTPGQYELRLARSADPGPDALIESKAFEVKKGWTWDGIGHV